MPPHAISLRVRLWATAILALIGSVALLLVSIRTIDKVKIKGPLYQNVVSYKDLLADILPPPEYLIESYLSCFELIKADGQERVLLLTKLGKLEADYAERNEVWQKSLTHPAIRTTMLEDSTKPALVFFKVLRETFIPLIQQGRTEEAQKVLEGPLRTAYQQHRNAIDLTVDLANKEVESVEAQADATLSNSMRSLLLAAIGINILVLMLTFCSIRSIMRPMTSLTAYARKVSCGVYDEACDVQAGNEIGELAQVLCDTASKVRENIALAAESERLAQAEAKNAQLATTKAQQALAHAEQAQQQGMLQAAMKLEEVVTIVGMASERLATQIEQSNKGAKAQAARASEVAISMEQMKISVLEVAQNASQTANTSAEAQKMAQEGSEVVRQVIEGIGKVQGTAVTLKDQMTALGQQSEGIGNILNVISDIADQTNLLALNAAIEAARAGDAGRGFAVVADEVRKLAEKTMTATKQVGEAITGMQHSTRVNVSNVDEAVAAISDATKLAGISGEALHEIVSLVETASTQVRSIATAANEQSSASHEISKAVDEVRFVSRETSESMNEAAQAVFELSRQANALRDLIQDLKSAT